MPFSHSSDLGRQPRCFLHIGTHKTGTTSLQNSLAANAQRLRDAGMYVPQAGRSRVHAGHHNIAWELNEDERFDPALGTLSKLVDEITAARASLVCLSSEDFEYLHDKPAALRRVRDTFGCAGYRVVIVVYLRPQASYAESLYAELVRHGFTDPFDAFLDTILRDGTIRFGRWRFTFDYDRLLAEFAAVFGAENLVVRPYTNDVIGHSVTADFLRTVGISPKMLSPRRLCSVGRLNTSLPFIDVMRKYTENISASGAGLEPAPIPATRAYRQRFDPVLLPEIEHIAERFAAGNQRVYEHYGTAVPFVSRRDLLGDIAAALGFDRGSEARRDFLRGQKRAARTRVESRPA